MAESSESDNDRSSLWSALSLLRNGQTDSNSSSGGTPTVPEHQPPPQVPNSSSVPATTTTVFSTSVFGLSQSMDIMNSATDFSVVFSPPPRIVPQEDPSSSGATPQEEESTHQQQHGMHVPEVAETDPILAMEVGREDDGVEERRDGNDKSMEESTREREIEEQERDVHVPAEEEADQASNIEELMETSRRNIIPMEERRIAEEKRRRELLLEQSKLFKTVRVPGELSTASDTMSSEGEGFIEPSNYLMKRRVCPGDVDQVTPLATHLSQFPSTSRDAALSMTDTTESEPEVVPGSKQTKEDKRPRKVPQQKRTSRDLRQDGGEENGSFRTTGSMTMRTSTGEGQVSDGRGTVPMNRDTTPPLPSSDGHDTALAPPLPSTSPPEQGFSSSQPSSSSSHSDTTELPPSTSQSSGSRSSDGSSITTTTSSSGSVLEVSGLTASSQGTDVQSVSSQTPALPLFSSTPNETDLDETVVVTTTDSDHPLMPPPLHPPMKHSSTDISTSSSGTSGYLYKNKGVVRLTGGGGDEETATAGIPTSGSTESLPSTPLAPATPTNDRSMEITNDVIPATPLSDVMESAQGGTVGSTFAEFAPSQDDLFQDTHPDSQFEVDNQLPRWMTRSPHQQHQGQQQAVKESTGSSSDDHSGPSPVNQSVISSKRPLLDSSSSSSSDSGMPGPSYSPSKPPPKRQRMSATPSTPDFNEPPKWMKQQMKSGLYHSTPSGNIAPPTETESSLTLSSAGSSPNKSSQSPVISATSSSLGSSGRSLSSGYLAGSSSIGSSGFTPPSSIVRESSSFTSTSVTQSGLVVVNKMAASVDTVEKSKVNVGSEDTASDNTNNNNGSGQGTVGSEGESGDVGKGGCKSGAEEGDSGDRRDGDGGGMVAMVSSSFSPECDGTAGHDADVSAVTGETSSNNNTPPLPLVASAGKENKETCSSNDTMTNENNEAAMNSNEGREELRQESKSQTVGEADLPCGTDKNDALHVQKADHSLRRDPLVEEMEVEESGDGMPAPTDQKDSEVDSTQMSFVLQLSLSQSEGAVSSVPPDPNANCNKTSVLPSQQTQDVIDLTSSISETMEFAVTQETETAPETDSAPSTPHNPQSPSTNEDTVDLTSPNVISSSHTCTCSQPDNSKGHTDVAVPISLKQSVGINSQSQGNLGSSIPPSEEMFTPPTPPHAASPKPSARPTYESVCYSSVDELQETPPLPEHHSGSVADEGKDTKQSKTAESPDSNQYSSSGTPFQFNLPAGNSILRPLSRITPPSQLHSSSSSAVMVEAGTGEPENHTHTPDKLTDGQRNVEAHSDDQVPSSSSSKELLPPSNKVPRLELDPQDTTTTTSKEDLVAIEKESNSSGTKNISSSLSKHGNGCQPMVEPPVSSSNLPSGGVASETEVQIESVANGRPKDDHMPPVTLAPFVIGDMRDGEEGENLDDSQTYVMPEITGMEDSEQDSVSTFNFCLRRPPPSQTEGVSQLPVSSTPQKQPSTRTQGNLSSSVIGIGLQTEDQTESEDISEDPFEFNSKTHVVMPIRRRRKPQAASIISNDRIAPSVPAVSSSVTGRSTPLAPVCSTDVIVNPVTNTCTSASGGTCTLTQASGFAQVASQGGLPGTPQTPSPQTPSPNAPMVITTPTNCQASNFIPMQYSTPPHPFPTVSTPTAVNQSQSSSNRSFEASFHHTPISFSSPSGFVQPHAIQSLCSGAQYVRLHHIRTVTTVRKFVSTEIIDRSTGSVLHSGFGEIESPQEQQQVSLQAEPLSSLPPGVSGSFSSSFAATPPPVSSLDNTSPTDQYPSSVPATGIKHVPPTSSFCFTPQLVNPPCSTGFLIPETPPTPTSLPFQASSRHLLSSSPSSSRTAPSPIMKTTLGHFDLKPGMRVVAKWRDNNWYAATVRKKTAKRVSLAFMDGDNDSAAVQYVLPLSLLPCGTSVFALEDEDSEDSTSSEQFGSFLEVDGQMFKMEIDSGTVTSCDLKRLMLTAEAGQMATKVALSSGRGDTSSVMKFFSGYVFLLTDQKKETPAMASGTGEAGYVKRETIEEMIKSRGGIIMDDYKASKVLEKKTFCLSNTYCRTVKYLIALAINIPCVSYEWVKECLKQNKFVSYQSFILPAGVSTVSKEVVNWSPRPKRFFQCTVYIHGDKAFKDFWEKVCSAGGAKILSRPPSKTKVAGQINIVIESNRSTVPQSIRDLRGIVHLVTSDWLVESFLQGAIADTKDFEV